LFLAGSSPEARAELCPMPLQTYLGVDPTCSEARLSGYAVLDEQARLLAVGLVATNEEILSLASHWRPRLVALDAPLSWPLEPDSKGRQCELLLAHEGIGTFRTTRRTIIRALVERGIRLAAAVRSQGLEVIEIYPYGSKVRLFGRPIPKKTTPEGRTWLRQRLEPLVTDLARHCGSLSHDELDAMVAAYTALLYDRDVAEEVGDPAEGRICLPLTQRGPRLPIHQA
jgi:predicted nuclease with RNAse H fold